MTTSRLLSTINPHRHSSTGTPISGHRFSRTTFTTGSPPFTGLTLPKQNKPITSPFILTTKPTPKLTASFVLKASYSEKAEEWADQHNIFVGTASYALSEAAGYFLTGFVLKVIINSYFSNRLSNVQLGLPFSSSGLYPLLFSCKQSPVIFARNYAIFRILMEATKYVVKRVRGKKDLKSRIWDGVARGLLVSLITATTNNVIVVGVCVFFALVYGLMFKVDLDAFDAWLKRIEEKISED